MQLMKTRNAPTHCAHFPTSPSVTVLFGANEDSADIGMLRVAVPAGASMPTHRHGGSDVILTPVTGSVRVTKDGEPLEIEVGDTLLILKDEAVALTNPHQATAELLVAAGPAAFISTVRSWPQVSASLAAPA